MGERTSLACLLRACTINGFKINLALYLVFSLLRYSYCGKGIDGAWHEPRCILYGRRIEALFGSVMAAAYLFGSTASLHNRKSNKRRTTERSNKRWRNPPMTSLLFVTMIVWIQESHNVVQPEYFCDTTHVKLSPVRLLMFIRVDVNVPCLSVFFRLC